MAVIQLTEVQAIQARFEKYIAGLDDGMENEYYETDAARAKDIIRDFYLWLVKQTPQYMDIEKLRETLKAEISRLEKVLDL